MVKDVKYMYWDKKDLFGLFQNRGDRDKNNEIGLKERGVIEMSNYSAFHIYAMHALFALY